MQPPFLGSCEVCQKTLLNYRSLAGHLRHNPDPDHVALSAKWRAWQAVYRATLRCRKCGELFEIADKAQKDKKRCPKCEGLRQTLGKRGYEAARKVPKPDTRQVMTASGSKAQWDGLKNRSVRWSPGDELYLAVLKSHESKEWINLATKRLGIDYKIYTAISKHALGERYDQIILERKAETMRENLEKCRFTSGLEDTFVNQLEGAGCQITARNTWITLTIGGQRVKREADIKLQVSQDHKAIILCDGEAFHGPNCKPFVGDPEVRIAQDRDTALAFFDLGYSVLRFSESEIHSGEALVLLRKTLADLQPGQRIYRNWCPDESCDKYPS